MLASMYADNSCVKSCRGQALKKVKTVTATANGMTRAGLDEFAKTRLTQGHSSAREMRTDMADISIALYSQLSKLGACHITFDNIDTTVAGVQHHLTQGYTTFELDPLDENLDKANQKSVREAKAMFTLDALNIGSSQNRDLKISLDTAAVHVTGQVISHEVEEFSWMPTPHATPVQAEGYEVWQVGHPRLGTLRHGEHRGRRDGDRVCRGRGEAGAVRREGEGIREAGGTSGWVARAM
jgi:hypothetical protein